MKSIDRHSARCNSIIVQAALYYKHCSSGLPVLRFVNLAGIFQVRTRPTHASQRKKSEIPLCSPCSMQRLGLQPSDTTVM